MKKRKLELKKKIVAALSDTQKSKILGGEIEDTYDCSEGNECQTTTCATECDSPTCNPENCA
jgi:hypothetical protein